MKNTEIRNTITQEIKERIQSIETKELIQLLKTDDDLFVGLKRLEQQKEMNLTKWKQKVQVALAENGYIEDNNDN